MSQVSDLLARKGGEVHTIGRGAMVFDAVKKMVDANVGSLIVVDGERTVGIFTERDYLRRIVLEGRTSRNTPVDDVMSSRVICVDPERTVEECMSMMTQQRIRHLPVMSGGRLAGIVSIGDVVKFLSRERETQIKYLTDYIVGKYPS